MKTFQDFIRASLADEDSGRMPSSQYHLLKMLRSRIGGLRIRELQELIDLNSVGIPIRLGTSSSAGSVRKKKKRLLELAYGIATAQ